QALRAMDERDPLVEGEHCDGRFWLHSVAKNSASQIHVSAAKRPEIVLFGAPPALVPPFSILVGPEFTLTAQSGDTQCTLRRFTLQGKDDKKVRKCSLQVADVLRKLSELNGDYADAVELLRQAESCRSLSCAVKIGALPRATT